MMVNSLPLPRDRLPGRVVARLEPASCRQFAAFSPMLLRVLQENPTGPLALVLAIPQDFLSPMTTHQQQTWGDLVHHASPVAEADLMMWVKARLFR